MIDDFELEWMASLDWSAHGPAQLRDVVPEDYLPLATVFLQLAQLMVDEWPTGCPDEYFLRCAGLSPRGRHPLAADAFDIGGRPIRNLHLAYGAQVRAAADEYFVAIASPDIITKEEWDAVDNALGEDSAWGTGARRVWSSLAPALATAAFKGEVETFVRPIAGGAPVFLEERFWNIGFEMAIKRAASGHVAYRSDAEPLDGTALPSHGILVPKLGLTPILEAVARANYATHMDLTGIGRLCRPIDEIMPHERQLHSHLVHLMKTHDPSTTSRDMLREMLNRDFGIEVGPRPFKRIWGDAVTDNSDAFKSYAESGRKRASAPAGSRSFRASD